MTRAGPTAARVRRIIKTAREQDRSESGTPGFEGLALLAERLAGVIDSAGETPRVQLAALRELRGVLATLTGAGRDGGRHGGPGLDGADGRDDVDRELESLMGSGPTGGDA